MNFKHTSKFTFFILFLLAFNLKAQEKKETTILYNTHPVKAVIDVNTKSLDYIINTDEDFMKGFRLEIPDYERYLIESANIAQDPGISNNNDLLDVGENSSASQNQMGSDFIFESNNNVSFISFTPGFATLSDASIRKLELVIGEYKTSNRNIILKTISISDTDLLSANRANAIKTYLKIRGIDTNAVSIYYLVSDKNTDSVVVEFSN